MLRVVLNLKESKRCSIHGSRLRDQESDQVGDVGTVFRGHHNVRAYWNVNQAQRTNASATLVRVLN